MDKVNVALVICPCWGREAPPLSIALLGGNLRSSGYKVDIFDINNFLYHSSSDEFKKYWGQEYYSYWGQISTTNEYIYSNDIIIEKAVDMILNSNSQVIGFSVYQSNLNITNEIARRIKQKKQDILIVYGGPQTSPYYSGAGLLENSFIDAIIVHEGDETIKEALISISETGYFKKLPGLIFKDRIGGIIDGGKRANLRNIDSLPFADYSDFDTSNYSYPNRLDIFSSRGCVNKCYYCDERNYYDSYRFRSGKNIYSDVLHQLNDHPNISFFNFSDSLLNGSIPAIREFCELVVSNELKINWGGQAIIRKEMTQDLTDLMYRAGCRYLSYGLESGSDRVLESMNKKLFNMSIASDVLRATHNSGIGTYINIMFGYPTETEFDFLQTLLFIKQNRAWIDAVSPSQSFMVILKNTYLYDHLSDFDLPDNPHHLYWKTACGNNTYPVRFKRYELFCKLCNVLDLNGVGVQDEKIDKWKLLGEYYFNHEENYEKAYNCYKNDLINNGFNELTLARFVKCGEILDKTDEVNALVSIFDFHLTKTCISNKATPLFVPAKHTDNNWVNGVAKDWGTAFFIKNNSDVKSSLAVGRQIKFVDGSIRSVTDLKEEGAVIIVYLDGAPLDGSEVGYPNEFDLL